MAHDLLRFVSIGVWIAVFIAFAPGAWRGLRGNTSWLSFVSLPICFSASNRLMFILTAAFDYSSLWISQVTGIIAGMWFVFVGYKANWHGN